MSPLKTGAKFDMGGWTLETPTAAEMIEFLQQYPSETPLTGSFDGQLCSLRTVEEITDKRAGGVLTLDFALN